MIIAGIISISLAGSWPKGVARAMFILFITCSFLIVPTLFFVWLVVTLSTSAWGYNQYQWIYHLQQLVGFLSLVPLIVFVASAKRMFTEQLSDTNLGPVWDTNLSKTQIKQISTKRNLAFVIDLLPQLIVLIGSLYLMWAMIDKHGNGSGVAALLPIGTIFSWGYLLLKETFSGQSVGKWLLDCRVVSARTGQPIAPEISILRNLTFIFPFMPLVELIVSKCREDGKRLGDLWADARVVAGPPQSINGIVIAEEVSQKKHPLDD